MNAILFNATLSDDQRRAQLYDGDIFVYAANTATRALCDFAHELCEAAFAPHHPTEAQYHLTVEEYNDILRELKPQFIHHPRSKELVSGILDAFGCDLSQTHFDVPRLRTSTSDGYMTSGLAYAFKPHRDIWYSPPMCQLNWWLPVYEICAANTMAFHPQYWNRSIKNSSDEFNYSEWQQTGRKVASSLTKADTRKQSAALEEVELEPQLRLVPEPGGMFIFSAAHLHSTVPNDSGRTRISIDFRTVHLDDLNHDVGAPNLDSRCSGTTIRDYLRGTDFTPLPEAVCRAWETKTSVQNVPG